MKTPYLHLVDRSARREIAARPPHESPELSSVKDAIAEADDSLDACDRLLTAGRAMIRAAAARRPSKAIESVSAWITDHADSLRERADPYPRAGDLREAVAAAADELDAATGREGALWRGTRDVAIGHIDPGAAVETATGGWLSRTSQVPNYIWVMALVGAVGILIGLAISAATRRS